ncbi:endonuclease/exonuclease/phosphatase family protein [Maribellus maritimus]|uniref:endonuclease/exonuclease/phosphatase family protein n=1 Tax=Maribellus maritimus TaxID=2870838 RepID=UPI001EEB23EE|nr:endonuclease/exonuclease/phosphatase family protein [Maribellus maritimus]MCG6189682.1 endonuclease/exonuclease/phosphatase family protein [Maribellus maritimus]
MKKFFKYVSRVFFFLILMIAIYLTTVILIGFFTDYHPDEISELEVYGTQKQTDLADTTFTFLSWNIGYAGLGAEMDFFYDGGKMIRPTSDLVEKYTLGILDFLEANDSINFVLLQEVDRNSSRTDLQDELRLIQDLLTSHFSSFGYNYKVRFVPIPLANPLAKVEMGQAIFSKYLPVSSLRYSFYSAYAWPKRLFMLDRCFIVSRFQLSNGKELVVINTHNSAYDSGGKLRNIEMPLIRNLMLDEYHKGNYVVAGGDWNQNPPNYEPEKFESKYATFREETLDRELFPDDWKIAFDPQKPTNRKINTPFIPGETEVTVIDYFILSPNIELKKIKALPLNFQYSDHEPVFLTVKIKD